MAMRDLPLGRKLTLGALLVSSAALSAALLACFAIQIHLARRSVVRDLTALAEIVAANAAGPLAFNDGNAATNLLKALARRSEIVGARLRDAKGAVLGQYQARGEGGEFLRPAANERFRVDGFHIYILAPVVHEGESLGTLELTTNVRGTVFRFATIAGAAFLAVLAGALLLVLFLADRWQRSVTAPLLALAGTAREVALSKDYTLRTAKVAADEIGQLAEAFNDMLSQIHGRDAALREAQSQLSDRVVALQREIAERQRAEDELARTHRDLVEASRRAGQAEVATSVLHNVGNVLNSVGVSATVASDRLQNSRISSVALAAKVLAENRERLGPFFAEDPKGRVFLDYLPQLGEHLETERASIRAELSQLLKHIEHIKEIVAMQQSYAGVGGVRELLQPVELVEHALALNADSIARHGVTVVRRYEDIPPFAIDKHRVLQILVNLISNAKNALTLAKSDRRLLEVSLSRADGWLRIAVVDNGVGIPPENLTQIFQHGFTTRKDGHGFGLHSGALAAQQMGGRLTGTSPGVGLGATFTLELPIDREKE